MHHEVFRLILEGLYRAPIRNPERILDIGTGTGVWAIEMADKYPEAEVIGMDLRYMRPARSRLHHVFLERVANLTTTFLARSNPSGR
jgi:ubiquinone/menaquinone biosynthesis C-methylase UbiE